MGDKPTKVGNLEHTTQLAGNSAGWRVAFPGDSLGLNFFQAAQLVPASKQRLWSQESSLQLGFIGSSWQLSFLPSEGASQLFLFTLAGLVTLISFRDFLISYFELCTFLFKELPFRRECFSLHRRPLENTLEARIRCQIPWCWNYRQCELPGMAVRN